MSDKVFEAKEHCKAAEKALKPNIFRWKPDHDSAADEYSQAAQCYRIARDLPNSMDCHLKASQCFKKNNAFFHAAKSLENAMIVNKEATPPEEIYNLAMQSSRLYQQHGSGDSGASVLDKAAKLIESTAPELAVKLFQQAADVSSCKEGEGKGQDWTDECDSDAPEVSDDSDTSVDSEDIDLRFQRIKHFVPKDIVHIALPNPYVIRYSVDAEDESLKDKPFLSEEAVAVKAREERGRIDFMNICQKMREFYLQTPGTTEGDKRLIRHIMHYMVEEYKRIVQYDRSKLNYAQKMRKFCKVIRQKRRHIKMFALSMYDLMRNGRGIPG